MRSVSPCSLRPAGPSTAGAGGRARAVSHHSVGYPWPCTDMAPVERYASPNKTCPILPPLSWPSPSWSTPFIFSIGVLDQPHAYTCRPRGEICVHPPFLDIESMHIHGIYIAARREDMHRSADRTHPPVRTPPFRPPRPPPGDVHRAAAPSYFFAGGAVAGPDDPPTPTVPDPDPLTLGTPHPGGG